MTLVSKVIKRNCLLFLSLTNKCVTVSKVNTLFSLIKGKGSSVVTSLQQRCAAAKM